MTTEIRDMIILGALSSSILPFLFVYLKDLFANIMIMCMNWHKGKPTFKKGTVFKMLILGSGKTLGRSVIEKVDFSNVYIKTQEGLLVVKKNDLRTSNGIIVLH